MSWALNPPTDLLSLEGVQPLAPSLDHAGLLAKDVEVTQRVFGALTDQPIEEAPARLRLGVLRAQFDDPLITAEVSAALEGALERLSASHEIVEIDDAPFAAIRETIDDIILYEAWVVHGDVVTATPMHFGPETLRLLQAAEHVTREQYEAALATTRDSPRGV